MSIINRSISEYNKDPNSEGGIIKIYHSYNLCIIMRKHMLGIDFSENNISERNSLWKKYQDASSIIKKGIIIEKFIISDIFLIYETISLLREKESEITMEASLHFRKIKGSIGIEVYE